MTRGAKAGGPAQALAAVLAGKAHDWKSFAHDVNSRRRCIAASRSRAR